MKRSDGLSADRDKARAWQERSAKKYQERQRARAREPKRSAASSTSSVPASSDDVVDETDEITRRRSAASCGCSVPAGYESPESGDESCERDASGCEQGDACSCRSAARSDARESGRAYSSRELGSAASRRRSAAAGVARKPRRNDAPWRRDVIALRGEWCRSCRTSRGLQCDHVMPRSQGGTSVVENGTMLCRECHEKKTNSEIQYRHEWLDDDQIEWLAAQRWVAWDADGLPYGHGFRHFAPHEAGQ